MQGSSEYTRSVYTRTSPTTSAGMRAAEYGLELGVNGEVAQNATFTVQNPSWHSRIVATHGGALRSPRAHCPTIPYAGGTV